MDVFNVKTSAPVVSASDLGDEQTAPGFDSLAFFQDVFLHSPEPMAVALADHDCLDFVNLAYAQMHGCRPEELIGRPLACLYPARCHDEMRACFQRAQETGFHQWDTEHVRMDGSLFPVSIKVRVLRDAQGHVRFRIASAQDISHRRRLEDNVQHTQRLLQTIADNSPAAISVKDKAGRYLLSNPLSDTALGVAPGGTIGKTDHDLFPAQYADVFRANDLAVLNSGQPQETEELVPTPDGPPRAFLCLKFPLFDGMGTPFATGLIATEITERREQQQRIEKLNTHLRRAMQETHHRVKNNLQVIASLAEIQIAPDSRDISVEAMWRIIHHIHSLAALHDLLTHNATLDEAAGVVPARELLKKMVMLLQSSLDKRRLRSRVADIRFSSRSAGPFALLVNELVSNAIKHGRGDIELTLTLDGPNVRLEVGDDGQGFVFGFDPGLASHTGLELIDSVVRLDLHGKVHYTNRDLGGALVVVTFPLVPPPLEGL